MSVDVFVLGQLQPHRNDIINFILNDCTTAAQTRIQNARLFCLCGAGILIGHEGVADKYAPVQMRCDIYVAERRDGAQKGICVAMGKGGKGKESDSEANKSARNMFFFVCGAFCVRAMGI